MKLDLTASRLCYYISKQVENINSNDLEYGKTTYQDIIKIALLNLYNNLYENKGNEKAFKLIYNPQELATVKNDVKYIDDLTEPKKQRQKIELMEMKQ